MKRPLGIIIFAVLAFMVGAMNVIWGLRMLGAVTFGPIESGNGVWLSGLFTLIVGLIYWSVAGALLSLKPWALMFAQIIAIFGLVNAVFAMFATGSFETFIGLAILPGFVFWYTNRAEIVEAFATSGNT